MKNAKLNGIKLLKI